MLKNLLWLGAVSAAFAQAPATGAENCCTILELRQYTLHPGQRDAFIPFFEREFIESQEAVGNTVLGQFRDLDSPDHFAWLRGFADMPARAAALQAFYGGEVWKAHRDAANAFFIDTDNVLLLHAVHPDTAFARAGLTRGAAGATQNPPGLLVATVYAFDKPAGGDFAGFFEQSVKPQLAAIGVDVRACYVTETTPNNFPRLPVRERDHVFVWFALYRDADEYDGKRAQLEALPTWRDSVAPELQRRTQGPAQVLRLAPTPRSLLHD